MSDTRIQRQHVKAVNLTDPIEKIATCARVCYKSEPKGEDANLRLVNRLFKSGHTSTYEHVYIIIEPPTKEMMDDYVKEVGDTGPGAMDPKHVGILLYSELRRNLPTITDFFFENPDPRRPGVVGDIRAFVDLINDARRIAKDMKLLPGWVAPLMAALHKYCPIDAFSPLDGISRDAIRRAGLDGNLLRISEYDGYQTVIIDTARMMTHELVRHRVEFSYSQESTRYCRYSDGLHITVSEPIYAATVENRDYGVSEKYDLTARCYKAILDKAQELYLQMIEAGIQPQIARGVLPLCTSATIAVTATKKAWHHWLKLRDASDADPMMQELAKLVKAQLPLERWDQQDKEVNDYLENKRKEYEACVEAEQKDRNKNTQVIDVSPKTPNVEVSP